MMAACDRLVPRTHSSPQPEASQEFAIEEALAAGQDLARIVVLVLEGGASGLSPESVVALLRVASDLQTRVEEAARLLQAA